MWEQHESLARCFLFQSAGGDPSLHRNRFQGLRSVSTKAWGLVAEWVKVSNLCHTGDIYRSV